VTVGS